MYLVMKNVRMMFDYDDLFDYSLARFILFCLFIYFVYFHYIVIPIILFLFIY